MMRATLVLLLATVGVSLGGCGFTPLYAAGGASEGLAAIDIHAPQTNTAFAGRTDDRTGFLLKQALTDALATGRGPAKFALETVVTERRVPRGVRVNNVANRYEINLTVDYRLSDLAAGKVVASGKAPVIVTYDSADPPYAGTVAAQDGEARAAQQAAIQIRLALARYFSGRPIGAPTIIETPIPQDTNAPP
jgi:LPS-assembly lipoprotein